MKTLRETCEEFLDEVFPDGSPSDQRAWLEEVFYAGACVALVEVSQAAPLGHDASLAVVETLLEECEAYAQTRTGGDTTKL